MNKKANKFRMFDIATSVFITVIIWVLVNFLINFIYHIIQTFCIISITVINDLK